MSLLNQDNMCKRQVGKLKTINITFHNIAQQIKCLLEKSLFPLMEISRLFKNKSSLPDVFCEKGVLRNFAKFTGKHLCQSLFFNKVAGCFCKKGELFV